jgi:threonyl-tRNA synthetase
VRDRLAEQDIRVECNEEPATLGAKIRKAELEKIPYLLIVGDREMEGKTVSVRKRKEGDLGSFAMETFLERVQKEIAERVIH